MNNEQMAAFAAAMNRPGQRILAREFFIYSTPRTSIASGAQAIAQISVQADADFLIEKTTYAADVAAAQQTDSTRVIPNVKAMLTITGSGRQLLNIEAPIPNFFGTGELPFIWPRPYPVPASSTLQVNFLSYEASATDLITLSFIGQKIFWGNPVG